MEDDWQSLSPPLNKTVLKTLRTLNFRRMTPVQAACIPLFINKKDVAAEAVTGSGKTVAFLIPIIEMLLKREDPLKKHEVGAVIITPTRELAIQTDQVLSNFLQRLPQFSSLLLIGGDSHEDNIEQFKISGGNILIATPGRLEAMLEKPQPGFCLAASVKALEVLVLDEADRLLDLGFEASLNTILSFLPKQRRTGLFSATQTDELEKLIRAGLRNPVRITVKEKNTSESLQQRTPASLKNFYMLLESDEKFNYLVHFLHTHKLDKVMVFFSTCAAVDYFSNALQQILKTRQVISIHGRLKKKRNKLFEHFRQLDVGVLICTDVMARGIDIPDVNWVIQYDPPSAASSFVHRCGRTARIGNVGNALVFLQPSEDSYIKFLEINQKVILEKMDKDVDIPVVLPKLKSFSVKDRAMFEKGMRAYVSFVQSYVKHECNMIFQVKDLDFGKLATGFGLLKIPRMPELRGKEVTNFLPTVLDMAHLAYRDKSREKQRQEGIRQGTQKKVRRTRPPRSEAWSKNKEKRQKKKKRREVKEQKKKRKLEEIEEDGEELNDDVRLMKKLKKGQITLQEFDKEFARQSESD